MQCMHDSAFRRWAVGLALSTSLAASACSTTPHPASDRHLGTGEEPREQRGLSVGLSADSVEVRIDGDLFTTVRLVGASSGQASEDGGHVPYLYPVIGPDGQSLTRNWPMKAGADEEQDHPHHRSLWFAHGDVNGFDFWTGRDGSRIEHQDILALEANQEEAALRTRNLWLAPDGKPVLADERTLTFRAVAGQRSIDVDVTLDARYGPVTLGDTKEGTMAIRVAPRLRLRGDVATGSILNSENQLDGDCWGKRASWVRYSGELTSGTVSIALLQHPENHRHPTWWHARDYGLLAANPFGAHDFEGAPPGTGDLTLAAGERLRLRYRFLFATGTLSAERLNRELTSFETPQR